MSRYIDADALKDKITDLDGGCAVDGTGFDIYTCEVFELIDEVPTADVFEAVHEEEQMSDLISRQDAIDEMATWDWQEMYLPIHFKQLLEGLPSAQQWILCSERLPEEGQFVLVTRVDNEVGCVIWDTWWYTQTRYPNKRPVAWMPLPQPWKEVEDEHTD